MPQSFPADMTVALIPMSAKPFHQAHYAMIERAATENDHVIVYVSTVDRARKKEIAVSGATMHKIWKKYLEQIMPSNVTIEYCDVPVRCVYEQLGQENERFKSGDHDVATYTLYSGADDIDRNFSEAYMEKYADSLWAAGILDKRVNPTAGEYSRDAGFTGTAMRGHMAQGDIKSFVSKLPDPLTNAQRTEIWNMLTSQG